MTQTYSQLQKQIDALQRQAEKLRDTEVKGVVGELGRRLAGLLVLPPFHCRQFQFQFQDRAGRRSGVMRYRNLDAFNAPAGGDVSA